MLRLFLLRHAKSSWDNPNLDDIERTLNERGTRTAPLMGELMSDCGLIPDKILCSSARRARDTLSCLLPHFRNDLSIELKAELYEGSVRTYLDLIGKHGGSAKNLLLIAHNPCIQEAALELLDGSKPELTAQISEHFPTAALAVLEFQLNEWNDLRPRSATASAFYKPRDLNF